MGFDGLAPSASLLLIGLLLDAVFGDPQLRVHPIRLMGDTLVAFERLLRRMGLNGYLGGIALFVLLAVLWVVLPSVAIHRMFLWHSNLGSVAHVLVVYILFAMRELIDHVRKVRRAASYEGLPATRDAIGMVVGRDTSRLGVCVWRRAA